MIKSLLSFILIWLIFLSTLGYTLSRLEDPAFLASQARKVNIYGRLSTQLPALLPKELVDSSPLSRDEWADVIRASIDGSTFYSFLDGYLAAEIKWLTGRSDQLNYSYSLVTIKEKAGNELTQKLLVHYDNLAPCKPTELKNWQNDKGFPVCKLPSSNVKAADTTRILSAVSAKTIADLPGSFSVESSPNQLKARTAVMKVVYYTNIIWGITALFLVLYLLILRRRAFFPLAGIFLVVGLLEIGFSLIAWDWLLKNIADWLGGKLDASLLPLLVDFSGAIMEVFKTILGNASIFTLIFGGVMLILGLYGKFRHPIPVVS